MKHISLAIFHIAVCLLTLSHVSATEADTEPVATSPLLCTLAFQDLSPEERKWFNIFLEGTFLVDGWKEITEDILASTPQDLRESQRKHLDQLGAKIGVEWSKDNATRRVDNSKLQQWGTILKKTAKKNPEQLAEVLVSIDQEVNNILN